MKKLLLIFAFLFVFIFLNYSLAYAETTSSYVTEDNIIITITEPDGSKEIKSIKIHDYNDRDYFAIRELSDACQADIEWIPDTKSIKASKLNTNILFKYNSNEIYYNGSKFDFGTPVFIFEGVSYAPIEIYKAFTDEFNSNETTSDISEKVSEDNKNSLFSIESGINSDRITFFTNPENIVRHFKLNNPDRLVIDINSINFDGDFPDGQTFGNIRYSKSSSGVTRFVFDLKEDYKYRMNANGNSFIIDISESGTFITEDNRLEYRNDSIIINTSNWVGYKISRSSEPFIIITEIPDRITNDLIEISGDGNLVEKITAEPSDYGSMIKIYTNAQCAFELEKSEDKFIVGIYDPVVENIIYNNHLDIPYIVLGESIEPNNIRVEYKSNGTYIIFNDTKGIFTPGQVYINDGFIKNLYVANNNGEVTIRIQSDEEVFANAESLNSKTVIYLNKSDLSGRLVVISAGHGGRDPGAMAGNVHEADINLSIAQKLNTILISMGIETLIIRNDDTYFSLDDRVKIANNNRAALFISIHSNALDDPDYNGLMTLVHSGTLNYEKINGRTAGEIIHTYLIEATGAVDRGVRYRDKIFVLKNTVMPAVEIEAGFLTNEAELSKLVDDTYQTTIAKAMAEGIADVLKYIE